MPPDELQRPRPRLRASAASTLHADTLTPDADAVARMDACVNRHNIFAILKGSHRESRKAFIRSNLASRQDVSPDAIDAIANQIFEALELN